MKIFWFSVSLCVVVAGSGAGQLARTLPNEKLLVLPLPVERPADSTLSVAVFDQARERLTRLAQYKILVLPKAKICEALEMSGFQCGILEAPQARDLARVLQADAYTTGRWYRDGDHAVALVRVIDIGGSGLAATFSVRNSSGMTPAALGDSIASYLNTIVKAGEHARSCLEARERSNLRGALQAAQRAFQVYPNSASAHLCIATVYEIQRRPADSITAALEGALAGDSLNSRALEQLRRAYLTKGDSGRGVERFRQEVRADPQNLQLKLAFATLLYSMKRYPEAAEVTNAALERNPGDVAIWDLKIRICREGAQWRCLLEGLEGRSQFDTTMQADSGFYGGIIGAAQQTPDTAAWERWSGAAVRRFPRSPSFRKARGEALTAVGRTAEALAEYRAALGLNPNDQGTGLLVAKALIEGATLDTARLARCRQAKDTVCVQALQAAFAAPMDTAKPLIDRVLGDSAQRLNAVVIMLSAGSRLAQMAQAFDRAYPWLDQILQLTEPRTPGDTTGLKQAVRVQASFWYGLSSIQTFSPMIADLQRTKSCTDAKAVRDRITRTNEALIRGRRVHPPTVDNIRMNVIPQYENYIARVKQGLRCTNF